MKISISIETAPPRSEAIPWDNLPFGRIFSRHMAVAEYSGGHWHSFRVQPLQPLALHPGTSALHYGQALFEGFKAYRHPSGRAFVFRLRDHWQRLNSSARRLVMPEVPYELFTGLLKALLDLERDLLPPHLAQGLYVRPVYFATDPWLGVRASESHLLLIYLAPVGAYYSGPIAAYVEKEMVRAAPGGTGNIKMAGNYAAALLSGQKAHAVGCQVSLWLDAHHHEWIEEFSTMNVFLVLKGPRLLTPPLQRGTILPGITRATLLYLAPRLGLPVEEREISIHEVTEGIANGAIREIFGTGTAATITSISQLYYEAKWWHLPPEFPVASYLLTEYRKALKGEREIPEEWIWWIET
ncbi:MAG: branched-chain amino acid aminotransferase [Bacteroidia bacterium]